MRKSVFNKTIKWSRKIIVVDNIDYKAICVDDYEYSPEKEANPESYNFIKSHRVNSAEYFNYKLKHISGWNYDAFQNFVAKEMEFIQKKM